MQQVDIALSYARNGINVFPLNPSNKAPLVRNGFKDASCDEKKIKAWWEKSPNALIGSPNGDFVVVDFDDYKINDHHSRVLFNMLLVYLRTKNLISESSFTVKTKSGGTHYYFRSDSVVSRNIGYLPYVDFLGSGGYTVLPDQVNYTANVSTPWDVLHDSSKLPVFDLSKWDAARLELIEAGYVDGINEVHEQVKEPTLGESIKASEKKKRECYYDVNVPVYEKLGIHTEHTPEVNLLDENGKIRVPVKGMTSELLKSLFFNRGIQQRLAEFMGIPAFEVGSERRGNSRTKAFRSIFKGHMDQKPSMGARWNREGTHIIVRDFSGFFRGSGANLDFNLVRLYTCIKSDAYVGRQSPIEFNTWFLRLLFDAGLLEFENEIIEPKFTNESVLRSINRTTHDRDIVAMIQLYAQIRILYERTDGSVLISTRFLSNWCGLKQHQLAPVRLRLIKSGFLIEHGYYGDNEQTKTQLFTINTDNTEYNNLNPHKQADDSTSQSSLYRLAMSEKTKTLREIINRVVGIDVEEETLNRIKVRRLLIEDIISSSESKTVVLKQKRLTGKVTDRVVDLPSFVNEQHFASTLFSDAARRKQADELINDRVSGKYYDSKFFIDVPTDVLSKSVHSILEYLGNEGETVTLLKMVLSQSSYQIVRNLAEDVGLKNVPSRSNMFVLVGGLVDEYKTFEHPVDDAYLGDNLDLIELRDEYTEGKTILMVEFDSPSIEKYSQDLFSELTKNKELEHLWDSEDDVTLRFVLSYDFGDEDISLEISDIKHRLKSYTGDRIVFDDVEASNYKIEDALRVINGVDVSREKQ